MKKVKKMPKEEAYGLRYSFKFWKWGIEIWEKGWLEGLNCHIEETVEVLKEK